MHWPAAICVKCMRRATHTVSANSQIKKFNSVIMIALHISPIITIFADLSESIGHMQTL